MRIAAISDIHGNFGALEAVLADINTHAPDLVVNLGDVLSGPLFPMECADLLIPLHIPTICGNHERQLLTLDFEEMGQSDRYTASCLRSHHVEWIKQFPRTLSIPEGILLVHGTPDSDTSYFLESVDSGGARAALLREVRHRAGETAATLILCGHSHIPRACELSDRCLIVNPGSVGVPAFAGDKPFPHKMETGCPHARYAILEKRGESWTAELRQVVYDWEAAARAAEKRQRPDWARALRTGFA